MKVIEEITNRKLKTSAGYVTIENLQLHGGSTLPNVLF